MNLAEQFKINWNKQFSFIQPNNAHFVIAASGGLDSTVLVHLLCKAGFECSLAHCNFQLRGEESLRDENAVKQLAADLNIECRIKHFDTEAISAQLKQSVQVTARHLRYEWFQELVTSELPQKKGRNKNYWIVTAHHADDNIETVLMNIFRGTGISGLHGILPVQDKLLRPLLFAQRSMLLNYAKAEKLNWEEDSSNAKDQYTRNFFRQHIIPLVKQVYTNADINLLHNIEKWKESEAVYQQAITQHKQQLCKQVNEEVHIPVYKLIKLPGYATILFEICKTYGFSSQQMNDVVQLLQSESGHYVASSTHRIIRNRNWLMIVPVKDVIAENILIESGKKKIHFKEGELEIDVVPINKVHVTSDANIALLDVSVVQFPLLLRYWKQGDYFYPLGLNKKKKLSRFFIDQKISVVGKEKIRVIESDKKIIWIAGMRIDHRFAIKPSTKQVLRIKLK